MKLYQIVRVAGVALCTSSTLCVAQAAPKSTQAKKEQNVPASRLCVGDVIYAIHGATGSYDVDIEDAAPKVASLSPLTLNFSGTYVGAKNAKMTIGDFAVITATGRRSGVVCVITVTKPDGVKFTRLAPQVTKEQNVPASLLRVGDVVYAMKGARGAWGINSDTDVGATVISLSPLTLSVKSPRFPSRNPMRMRIGNFAVVTSAGQQVGTADIITVTKPDVVRFTRLKK